MMQFTAISVFIETEGKQTVAVIDSEMASMFVHMIAGFQKGQPKNTRLSLLPEKAGAHVIEARNAMREYIEEKQKDAP